MSILRPNHLGLLILSITLIPPIAFQYQFSAAAGVMVVSIMSILSVLFKAYLRGSSSRAVTQVAKGVGLFFVYLLVSALVSLLVHPNFDLTRFSFSLIAMLLCLTGSYYFSAFVNSFTEEQVDKAFRFVFIVLLFSSLAGILEISLPGLTNSRSVFFYNEPSHYAIGLAPFLFYMVVTDASRRWIWIVSALAIALALQSFTLLIVVLLTFALLMRSPLFIAILALLILLLSSMSGDGLSYYADRALLSSESTNLSNLVYLSGWERAFLSINETFGFGCGLNQLGIVGSQGTVMVTLSELNADGLNLLDGGSVATKFIAEFGLAGLLLLMIYVFFLFKGIRFVRSATHALGPVSRIKLSFWSCFIMYSIDLFVRGAGYFSAESFMFFASIWGLAQCTGKMKQTFV